MEMEDVIGSINSYITDRDNPYWRGMLAKISRGECDVEEGLDFLFDLANHNRWVLADNIKFIRGFSRQKPNIRLTGDLQIVCAKFLIQSARASADNLNKITERYNAIEENDTGRIALLFVLASTGDPSVQRIFDALSEERYVQMVLALERPVVDAINALKDDEFKAGFSTEENILRQRKDMLGLYRQNQSP